MRYYLHIQSWTNSISSSSSSSSRTLQYIPSFKWHPPFPWWHTLPPFPLLFAACRKYLEIHYVCVTSYSKTRPARGTVNIPEWHFPDHCCFSSLWDPTPAAHSITLSDEAEVKRKKFITVPVLDGLVWCFVLSSSSPSFFISLLPLPSFSVGYTECGEGINDGTNKNWTVSLKITIS